MSEGSREPGRRRIAVLRALPGLGDLLCLVPALRALRLAEPDAHVTLLGLEGARWFAERFDDLVDDLLPVRHRMLPETACPPAAEAAFLDACRRRRFDVAVQAHGHGPQSNDVTVALAARCTVLGQLAAAPTPPGAHLRSGPPRPDGAGDGTRVVAFTPEQHEVDRLLAVAAAAGWPPSGRELSWRARPGDPEADRPDLPRPRACLHPGASLASRRWPLDAFARVGEELRRRSMTIVLTGNEAEAPLTAELDHLLDGGCLDLAGRTTLADLAAVIGGAEVVVCNDTGVSHLAGALGTPSVVVFTATSPARWGPPADGRHISVDVRGELGGRGVEQVGAAVAAVLDGR